MTQNQRPREAWSLHVSRNSMSGIFPTHVEIQFEGNTSGVKQVLLVNLKSHLIFYIFN